MFSLNGYRIFRSDRSTHAGGVAIYIKDSIPTSLKLVNTNNSDIEYVFIEIKSNGQILLVGCTYRPNKNICLIDYMSKIESLTLDYQNIIIAGDFNCNALVDSSLTTMMGNIGLYPTNVSVPTHFTQTNSTLLDMILHLINLNRFYMTN